MSSRGILQINSLIELCRNSFMIPLKSIFSPVFRIFQKKLPNDLSRVLTTLEPFQKDIKAIAVESTYNWYWLVDGLMDAGYPVDLANPAGMPQYSGLKHADDKSDAFFLAELLRLNILPKGYIYPREERAVRDMLRRRMMLVQHRTTHILSFQGMISRQTGSGMPGNTIKTLKKEDIQDHFGHGSVLKFFWGIIDDWGSWKLSNSRESRTA